MPASHVDLPPTTESTNGTSPVPLGGGAAAAMKGMGYMAAAQTLMSLAQGNLNPQTVLSGLSSIAASLGLVNPFIGMGMMALPMLLGMMGLMGGTTQDLPVNPTTDQLKNANDQIFTVPGLAATFALAAFLPALGLTSLNPSQAVNAELSRSYESVNAALQQAGVKQPLAVSGTQSFVDPATGEVMVIETNANTRSAHVTLAHSQHPFQTGSGPGHYTTLFNTGPDGKMTLNPNAIDALNTPPPAPQQSITAQVNTANSYTGTLHQ